MPAKLTFDAPAGANMQPGRGNLVRALLLRAVKAANVLLRVSRSSRVCFRSLSRARGSGRQSVYSFCETMLLRPDRPRHLSFVAVIRIRSVLGA